MSARFAILGVLLIALAVIASMSLFVVREDQQVLVLRFGEFVREVNEPSGEPEPGLHFKWPLINSAVYLDKRILNLDAQEEEILLAGQQRLVVDAFARWRIVNPRTFYAAVQTESLAESRLNTFLISATRNVLADVNTSQVLSDQRDDLMQRIAEIVHASALPLGIEVIDVRLRAADLPEEIQDNVFRRMRSERQQEATLIRAEGEERFRTVKAAADREVAELISEAERKAQQIRGQADEEAIRIYADAFSVDPEFYSFYRSLEAYRAALADSGTTLLLTPDSDFFRFFGQLPASRPNDPARPRSVQPAPAPAAEE